VVIGAADLQQRSVIKKMPVAGGERLPPAPADGSTTRLPRRLDWIFHRQYLCAATRWSNSTPPPAAVVDRGIRSVLCRAWPQRPGARVCTL